MKIANVSIDKEIFDFVFGCALVDAVQMQAYPYKHKPKTSEYPKAVAYVRELVQKVENGKYPANQTGQNAFDEDFFKTAVLVKTEISHFTFGNTQKLINLVFKHMYVATYLNNTLKHNFDVCHCPVDSIMLDKVWKLVQELNDKYALVGGYGKAIDFKKSWSREDFSTIEEYKASRYMCFQSIVRVLTKKMGCSPIEFDYLIWQQAPLVRP